MAKVIFEFDPIEDKEEMDTALNGWKWKALVWDLDQELRSKLKHSELTDEAYEALDAIREKLHELKNESGLYSG